MPPPQRPSAGSRLAAYGAAAAAPLLLTLLVFEVPSWPKPYSWQYLGIAVGVAILAGIRPGLVALLVATGSVLWLGVPTPVHPGVEMFVAIDLCLLALLHRWRRAQEQLAAALTEEDRRKNEFIAILSHELRNPLAPIRYAIPVLRTQPLTDAGERAVAVIDRQVGELARLVDDLVDVSHITDEKLELLRKRRAAADEPL